ncbi:MAG: TrkH family potassium uptake protein [Leptospiraceae bacterium]|nr:TrkH family potassium uptake protein [Leptospiraceae bacterium]MCP5497901.1 TrkH family potassium uptake protein [Leptospiraceae bacterium]
MKFNLKVIIRILGLLTFINGFFMLLCLPFSLYYGSQDFKAIIYPGFLSILAGLFTWILFNQKSTKKQELTKRDAYIVVTLCWVFMSATGSLPYVYSGVIPNFTDAFFETMSGYSTTGASVLNNIESIPKGILLWRSMTQWIGGMGIIVLAVAILPILGIGGMELFVAEAPGISPDKLKPRIKETAKRLWIIYVGLTVLETILLMGAGMSFYDAINHSFTTMSSGGFSTKQDSVAFYNSPLIEYIIILFMFIAGTNFTVTYFILKRNFQKVVENEEFKYYFLAIAFFTIMITYTVYKVTGHSMEQSFRDSMFQVVSIVTTTGFVTADYTLWSSFATVCFFILMFFGASAGSTAGGIKIVRHVVLLKNSLLELKRQMHPSAIIPVRLNKKGVSQETTYNIIAFIMIYIMIFAISSIIMAFIGVDFMTSIGAVATSLGNIGPGLGKVGPVNNFAEIPQIGKWLLSLLMLLGRLELFTVLILFSPYFWKRY